MARTCTVCKHPKRNEIEIAIAVDGSSYRSVADRFGLSETSLKRHVSNGHITPAALNQKQIQSIQEKSNFERNHQERIDDLMEQKARARAEGNAYLELAITKELIRLHDIDGKAAGVYREKIEHSGNAGAPLAWAILTPDEIEREVLQRVNGPPASVQPPESRKKPGKNVERKA